MKINNGKYIVNYISISDTGFSFIAKCYFCGFENEIAYGCKKHNCEGCSEIMITK